MQHAGCGSCCCDRPQQLWPRVFVSAPNAKPTRGGHVACALPARLAERHASKEAGRATAAEEKARAGGKGGKGKQRGTAPTPQGAATSVRGKLGTSRAAPLSPKTLESLFLNALNPIL